MARSFRDRDEAEVAAQRAQKTLDVVMKSLGGAAIPEDSIAERMAARSRLIIAESKAWIIAHDMDQRVLSPAGCDLPPPPPFGTQEPVT